MAKVDRFSMHSLYSPVSWDSPVRKAWRCVCDGDQAGQLSRLPMGAPTAPLTLPNLRLQTPRWSAPIPLWPLSWRGPGMWLSSTKGCPNSAFLRLRALCRPTLQSFAPCFSPSTGFFYSPDLHSPGEGELRRSHRETVVSALRAKLASQDRESPVLPLPSGGSAHLQQRHDRLAPGDLSAF